MIISRRDEGMAVACQGLTADLVISSSLFEGVCGESNTSGKKSGARGAGDWRIYCDAAVLLLCFFFVLTQWTCREQGAVFYRSHATSQWSMDAGPLQTYTVEHALCGSAKRDHLGEKRCIPPLLLLWLSVLWPSRVPRLLPPSIRLDCKLLKDGDSHCVQCRVLEF